MSEANEGSPQTTGSASLRLQRGREVCPACNRKGLGYAMHPHAYGWKDYDRASCRYCRKTFRIRQPNSALCVKTHSQETP